MDRLTQRAKPPAVIAGVVTAVALVVAAAVLTAAIVAAPASAHEVDKVGELALEIGWGTEPAYVGQLNSVQVVITHKADGDPIEDPGAALKATVIYGDRQTTVELTPAFEDLPGQYRALLVPTAPGDYAFHVIGTVEGVAVDIEVASGPQTFSTVEDVAAIQFPVKAPTSAELARRLDAELARVPTASEVSSARTFGMAGLAVACVAVVLAAVALLRRRA